MEPSSSSSTNTQIPIEIISEEEMAFLELALASARPILSPMLSPTRQYVTTGLRHCSTSGTKHAMKDIEDSSPRQLSFLLRYRRRRALSVTDITSAEWCEKQTEFSLTRGKPKKTAAMQAGCDRHTELEKEVVDKVEIRTESLEETWAIKFFNFIVGARQLLFEGLTRELPVIGVFRDTWIVGVIDELRMPLNEASLNPILVDTKTRYKATLPAEAQKRNARFQLMCYKYLWDGLVAGTFSTKNFLEYFRLNPQYILSEEIRQYSASLGFDTKTFDDVVTSFRDSCLFLSLSQDLLILRYELQSDCSLLEEHKFPYDEDWLRKQLEERLMFWSGERESKYVSKDEIWKCRICNFNNICPMASKTA